MTINWPASMTAGVLGAAMAVASGVASADAPKIVIGKDAFQPKTLTIAADKRVQISVSNESALPAEFEGKDFSTEKVIPASTTLPVYIGPLEPGTYHFFNEFAPTVTGTLIVK